jgi:hypothetical protein
MKPNRFAALLLLLILAILLCAQFLHAEEFTYSAMNTGGDWQARDQANIDNTVSWMNVNPIEGKVYWFHQYVYVASDSSIEKIDCSWINPLIRRFEPSDPASEAPVEPVWVTIEKHSPAKPKMGRYSGWDGGPQPTGVHRPLKQWLDEATKEGHIRRAAVNKLAADGKTWKDKGGKTLSKQEKRKAAWRIVTGKSKKTDYIIPYPAGHR